MKNNVKKQYIKELSRELGKKTDIKRAFIADIDAEIQDFLDANNDADILELYKEFGTPSDIAGQFIGKADLSKLKKKARKYLFIRIVAFVFALVALILVADILHDIKVGKNSHITVDNNFASVSTATSTADYQNDNLK